MKNTCLYPSALPPLPPGSQSGSSHLAASCLSGFLTSSLVFFLAPQLSPTHTKSNMFNQPCAEVNVVMQPSRKSQYNRGGSKSKELQRPSGRRHRDRVMRRALWDGSAEGFTGAQGIMGRLSAGIQRCTGHHGKAQCRGPGVHRASWEAQ